MGSARYERYKESTKARVLKWQKDYPEKLAIKSKRYRQLHHSTILAKQAKRRAENRDAINAYQRAYRAANLEHMREVAALWRIKNRARIAAYNRKYQDRKARGLIEKFGHI